MRHSIRLKISILFVSVFVLISILFVICLNLELNLSYKEQSQYHESIVKSLIDNYNSDTNITSYFLARGFTVLDNAKLAHKIREEGENYFTMATDFGRFSSVFYDYALFLRAVSQKDDVILQSKKDNLTFEFIFFGFLLSMALVFILYLLVMKSLQPLEKLKKQITHTLNDGKDFLTQDYEKDEIGEIATNFSDTIDKMHELAESRRLFLRTIMHEFKTPIGKGRIIAAMMKEKKQKARLVEIFKRLDTLIEESAKIESLYSKNYQLHIRTYSFDEILSQAKKLLLYDDIDKKIKLKNKNNLLLEVDIDSFSLVVKNLIENAIKYSDDKLCLIECFEDYFIVKNKGKALKQPYTEYLKAFSKDKENKNSGMGLGLYIVDRTCKSHNFELSYEYVNAFHCFKVTPPPHTYLIQEKTKKMGKKSKKQNEKRKRINNEAQK